MFFGAPIAYHIHPFSAAVALLAVPSGMLGADIRELQRAYDFAEISGGDVLSPAIDQYIDGLKTGDRAEVMSALSEISSCVESTEFSDWRKVKTLFFVERNESGSFAWVTTPALGLPTRSQVLGMCRADPLSPQGEKFLDLCDCYAKEIEGWESLYVLDLQTGHFDGAAEILDWMKQIFSKLIEAVAYDEGESVLMGNVLLRFGVLLDRLYQVGARFQQADEELTVWVPTVFGLEAAAWMHAGVFEMADKAFERGVRHLSGVSSATEKPEVYAVSSRSAAEFSFRRAEAALLNGEEEIYFQAMVVGIDILRDLGLTYRSWNQEENANQIFNQLLEALVVVDAFREWGDWEKVWFLAHKKIEIVKRFSAIDAKQEFLLLGGAYTFLGEASLQLDDPLDALENYLWADWVWKEAQTLANKNGDVDLILTTQEKILKTKLILEEEVFDSHRIKRAALISVLAIAFLEEQILPASPILDFLLEEVEEIFRPFFVKVERALMRAGFSIKDIQPPGVHRVLQLIDSFEMIAPHFSGSDREWLSQMVDYAASLLEERRSRFVVRLERPQPDQLVTYCADGSAADFIHGNSEDLDSLATRWRKQHRLEM